MRGWILCGVISANSRMRRLSSFWLWGLLFSIGWQMLGAMDFSGVEHRERLHLRYFEQRYEPSLRSNVEKEISYLCKDVAKAVNLSAAELKALEEKLKPVAEAAIGVWRLALRHHYMTMPTVEDAESFTFLGDALIHAEVVAADVNSMQLWDSILKAELGEERFRQWKARETELRAAYHRANEPVVSKLIQQAVKSKTTFLQAKLQRVAEVLGWTEEKVKPLQELVETSARTFEKGYSERLKKVSLKEGELILGCSSEAVSEMQRRQTRVIYPPRLRALQDEVMLGFDAGLDQRMSAQEREKLQASQADLVRKITEAGKRVVAQQLERVLSTGAETGGKRLPLLASLLKLPSAAVDGMDQTIRAGEEKAKAEWTASMELRVRGRVVVSQRDRDPADILKSMESGNWRWVNEEVDQKMFRQCNAVWQKALRVALTPEQLQQWLTHERQQRERKASALVKLTVSEVDLKVRLQAKQREALEPALRPVADKVAQIPGGLRAGLQWGSLDGSLMLLEGLEKGRLEELLTPQQMGQLEATSARYKAYWRAVQAKLELLKEDAP